MCNAMLAQRISAINSITALCEETPGCDVQDVKAILQSDKRIGSQYLQCSLGFGGSCFEKDLQSFIYILGSNGQNESAAFWQGVLNVNQSQKTRLAKLVSDHELIKSPERHVGKRKIAVFGFSYKKNTSDTRCTPAATVVANFASSGFSVAIHDP